MLLKSVFLSIATANLSRDKNPDCSSDNPEFACTADCENLYIECVIGCSTDPSCISSCNRESMKCNQQCPCHDNCYDGCPCEYETVYCKPCMEEFFYEYIRCEDKISFAFINCTDECKGDHVCFDKCQADAVAAHKNCPCRDNCPDGCPCPSYTCG